jgi:hypothetical protein
MPALQALIWLGLPHILGKPNKQPTTSDFLNKFRFKLHRANTVDFAVDVMVTVN